MLRTRRTVLLSTLILLAGGAVAAPAASQTPSAAQVVAGWEARLAEADRDLLVGKHKRARRTAEALLAELTETLAAGPVANDLIGRAESARALATAGAGDAERAAWDWAVARALRPATAELELEPYGEAGARLAAALPAAAAAAAAESGVVEPPRKRKGNAVRYPRARLLACEERPAEVAVTVGIDGKPSRPAIAAGQDAVLAWVALEALRGWRFEPARGAAGPVAARFVYRTDLDARRCRDLLATQQGPAAHDFEADED
jgi:outer membrane biosynthesis protein TonB